MTTATVTSSDTATTISRPTVIPGAWVPVSDEVEERVANADLRRDRKLPKPIHFTCVKAPNLRFMLGAVDRQDRWGKRLPGRTGKWFQFYNGHFQATTEAQAAYCRARAFIYEEPEDGPVYEHPTRGFATRNKECWTAFLTKLEE